MLDVIFSSIRDRLAGELVKTWEQGTAPEPENILDEIFGSE